MVAHAFNPSTREAEAGGFLSWRPAWSTKWVPGQPGLYRETLSQKTNKQTKNQVWEFILDKLKEMVVRMNSFSKGSILKLVLTGLIFKYVRVCWCVHSDITMTSEDCGDCGTVWWPWWWICRRLSARSVTGAWGNSSTAYIVRLLVTKHLLFVCVSSPAVKI